MDFHHASLALNEWLEATAPQPQDQQPELAFYCEAINPATNEVAWDDWLDTDEQRRQRLEQAAKEGLTLTIEETPDEVWA